MNQSTIVSNQWEIFGKEISLIWRRWVGWGGKVWKCHGSCLGWYTLCPTISGNKQKQESSKLTLIDYIIKYYVLSYYAQVGRGILANMQELLNFVIHKCSKKVSKTIQVNFPHYYGGCPRPCKLNTSLWTPPLVFEDFVADAWGLFCRGRKLYKNTIIMNYSLAQK